mmetsp:Transcript_7027/g.16073  ORF Transcript_7027/g.16073 Transcript_7027/m.16073 type:complete len:212 (+) Transcript_7027:632-1267(+)
MESFPKFSTAAWHCNGTHNSGLMDSPRDRPSVISRTSDLSGRYFHWCTTRWIPSLKSPNPGACFLRLLLSVSMISLSSSSRTFGSTSPGPRGSRTITSPNQQPSSNRKTVMLKGTSVSGPISSLEFPSSWCLESTTDSMIRSVASFSSLSATMEFMKFSFLYCEPSLRARSISAGSVGRPVFCFSFLDLLLGSGSRVSSHTTARSITPLSL